MDKQTLNMMFTRKLGLGFAAMFSCMLLKNDHVFAETLPESAQPEMTTEVSAKVLTEHPSILSDKVEENSASLASFDTLIEERHEIQSAEEGLVQHYDFENATSADKTIADKTTGQ